MKDKKFLFKERQLESGLTHSFLTVSERLTRKNGTQKDLSNLEMISETEKPYVSPIFTMSEEEIIAFVEEFDVRELATLSVAELNRIGEVLGVDPAILAGVEEA